MPEQVWKPHVTVAALIAEDEKFLLVREKIKDRIVFNQPAGHLEAGESLIEAVIRETREETQYQFRPTGLVGIYRYNAEEAADITYLRFCFCGDTGKHLGGALDEDIIAAEWMTIDEVSTVQSQHRSPLVLQCINDFLQKEPYSLHVISSVYA